jgi:hypothetical protein
MIILNADILYGMEMFLAGLFATVLPLAAWPIGMLYIHSKLLKTNEASITWLYKDLQDVSEHLEHLIIPHQAHKGLVIDHETGEVIEGLE